MTYNEIIMSIEMGLIYGIIAIGIYLTFRVINFPDLTCDGSFVLGAAICGIMIKSGYNPILATFSSALGGAAAGFLTGMLYTKFRVTNLLAGILMSFMLYSINLHIMGGIPNLALLDRATIFIIEPVFLLFIVGGIVSLIIAGLLMTDFGLALSSIGQNIKLSQNSGINVPVMTIIGLALSNAVIALGGGLFSQHQGFSDVSSGVGTVIIGLASVMIGERILPYKSIIVQLLSCLIGSIIYRLFVAFALHSDALGIATHDINLITGIMVIAIMNIPQRRIC